MPPSTKSRWDAKLRILKLLFRILPINCLNVEDIQAISKKGQKRWNKSFSTLEVGKNYFYQQIEKSYPDVELIKTSGRETSAHRKSRGFPKTSSKLNYTWDAHNSDSHSLEEIALGTEVLPYQGLYKIEFLEYYRRQLHVQNYYKGHIRKNYGTTVSEGMSRGSVVRDKQSGKIYYLGGSSKAGYVAIHNLTDKKRFQQFKKVEELAVLYCSKYGAQFLPCYLKRIAGGSLRK